jgi:hypothetical protein
MIFASAWLVIITISVTKINIRSARFTLSIDEGDSDSYSYSVQIILKSLRARHCRAPTGVPHQNLKFPPIPSLANS